VAGRATAGGGLVLAGAVLVVLALTLPGLAAGTAPGGTATWPPPNNCAAPILPCYIYLSVYSGSHGNRETVTGVRFWPGEPFYVYFWNGTADGAVEVTYGTTDYQGDFAVSFRVPADPVGNYTVLAVDPAGDNQSAAFHLTYLRAHPDSGPVANTTSLSGQGFLPDRLIDFQLHGANASTRVPCRTNANGNFSGCLVKIPKVRTGGTLLTATDGLYTARVRFTVS
jgi:hypothetical protein